MSPILSRTVLVTSAAGAQGRDIVRRLLAAGMTPRVLLRPGKANPFGAGVEAVPGDLADFDSLRRASLGADALALTLPQIQDRQALVRYGRNAVDAAKAGGVRHIVFNATGLATAGTGVAAMEAKAEVMGHLHSAGVPFTVLRPTLYLENLLSPASLAGMLREGVLAYPLPADYRVSWLSRDDLAAFVAAALARPELAGNWFDLGGPDTLTGLELAAILADATGRHIRYVPVAAPEFAARLNAVLGAGVGDEIAAIYAWFDRQRVSPLAVNATTAAAALGVQPTGVRAWAEAQNWPALAALAA